MVSSLQSQLIQCSSDGGDNDECNRLLAPLSVKLESAVNSINLTMNENDSIMQEMKNEEIRRIESDNERIKKKEEIYRETQREIERKRILKLSQSR